MPTTARRGSAPLAFLLLALAAGLLACLVWAAWLAAAWLLGLLGSGNC